YCVAALAGDAGMVGLVQVDAGRGCAASGRRPVLRLLLISPAVAALTILGPSVAGTFAQEANSRPAPSDPVIAGEQRAFFEAWLRREPGEAELRKATDEFVAFYARKGMDQAATHEATKPFLEYAQVLRERDGSPIAFEVRHLLLEANYFLPE